MVRKISLFLASLILIAAGTAYFAGLAYFQTHYKAGTKINGFQCSLMTTDDAEALLVRSGESYALEVDTRNNGVEEITATDAGLSFCGRGELDSLLEEQNYWLWFLPVDGNTELTVDAYSVDSEKLDEAVSSLSCMQDMIQAKAAYVTVTSGFYQVSPAVRGTELDVEKAKDVIGTAMRQWKESVNLEEAGCYIDADGPDEETLQANCDLLNGIQEMIITYDFGDRTETVDFDVVKTLLDEYGALDQDLIQEYLKGLAEQYDTVGAERKFITYDDQTVAVSGGDYGWEMDIEESARELTEMIENGVICVADPVYESEAVSRNKDDIGRSYLEIDMAGKTAVLYVDGEPILQTDIHVGSGLTAGTYKIHSIEEDRVLLQDGSIYPYEQTSTSGFSGTEDIIGMAASGVEEKSIALDTGDMETIIQTLDSTWPVVIY